MATSYWRPPERAHIISSRDIDGGFEYYCRGCAFRATWVRGQYIIVERGSLSAHKRAAGEEDTQKKKPRARARRK